MTKHTTNLRPEVALALADLLESGEFEQCKGRLRQGAKLCAEGALCELCRRETGQGQWIGDVFCAPHSTSLPTHGGGAPSSVCRWALRSGAKPFVGGRFLVNLNDQGATFPELARMLREAAGAQSDG